MTTPTKTISPGATLDFELDWSDPDDPWLQDGEAIASYEVSVAGGLVKVDDDLTGSVTKAWVTAPEDLAINQKVYIRFEVTTDSTPPRTDARYWELTVIRRPANG